MSQGLSGKEVKPGTLGLDNLCVLGFVSCAVPDTHEGQHLLYEFGASVFGAYRGIDRLLPS